MDIKNFLNFKKVKKSKFFKPIAIILVIAIIGGGSFAAYKAFFAKKASAQVSTAKAARGDISVEISGGGTLEAIEQYTVTSLVKGEIISAPFEEGQIVNKGDLLYKIDTKDIENTIAKSQLNLEKTQQSYNQTLDDINKLTVKSPIAGTITNLYVDNGDNISANGKIADIVNKNEMLLTIPFISTDADKIYVGQSADVTLNGSFYKLSGTVTRISTGELISAAGITVKTVEISVTNPGSIKENDTATAIIGNVACNDSGTFTYKDTKTITAEVSGKISGLNHSVGDRVSKGETILKLSSDSLQTNKLQNDISLKDAQLSLQNQYDQLDNYNITSPISGTVIQKTSKEGDTLDNSNSQVQMAVIADLSKIIFKINVDELDIGKIELNQKVEITADAVENKTYTGYVDYISIVGTSSNGTTSYPVTVAVENPEKLIPGMNVDAKIVVESKENVLKIPVSAVRRGNLVYVKSDDARSNDGAPTGERPIGNRRQGAGPDSSNRTPQSSAAPQEGAAPQGAAGNSKANNSPARNNVPEGFKAVKVETGINDEDYIEILSGLNEGDIVYIPTIPTTTNTQQRMMGGMPGGGYPGGGYPSGGMGGAVTRQNSGTSNSTRQSGTGGASR